MVENNTLSTPPFDVDGQATVTSGTWSFDCSIAAVMQSEISIAPVMNSISIAPFGFEFSASLISIAVSATMCNWNYNLLPTETYEWTPYAREDSTVYLRQTFIGDKDKGGGKCLEKVYGSIVQEYDKKGSSDEVAYSRTVTGDTEISSVGKYNLSATSLSLSSTEQAVIYGEQGIQLKDGLKDGQAASIEVKDGRFTGKNLKEFDCQAAGNVQVTASGSVSMLGAKVNLDTASRAESQSPSEPPETAKAKKQRLAERTASERWEGFVHKGKKEAGKALNWFTGK
jgi:hypothetical protein